MITETEKAWLSKYCPGLKISQDGVEISGEISFTASYDSHTNSFTWLMSPEQTAPGKSLSNTYKVVIKKSTDVHKVPSLEIEDANLERIPDRHFYTGGKACLCGPVEEYEFMCGDFSFLHYLEKFVVPFLYGQSFYDINKKWPWDEYAHGSAGALESYYRSGHTREHAQVCIQKMQLNKNEWPRMQKLLSGEEYINGATNCICNSRHKMKNHLAVWSGLFKLRRAVTTYRLSIKITNGQESEDGSKTNIALQDTTKSS